LQIANRFFRLFTDFGRSLGQLFLDLREHVVDGLRLESNSLLSLA